jgi:hypothetical protein
MYRLGWTQAGHQVRSEAEDDSRLWISAVGFGARLVSSCILVSERRIVGVGDAGLAAAGALEASGGLGVLFTHGRS